jgi:hypothetical protein
MADVFVPLNRFQSVIAELSGEEDAVYNTPKGVSTIVLSAQITNTGTQTNPVTIFITPNRELPSPNFEFIYSGSVFISGSESLAAYNGSFTSASNLLAINNQFIRKEVAAYIQFQNNLSETPFGYSASFYETNILRDVNAVAYDLLNKTTLRTNKAALSYYDKDGDSIIPTGQVTASVNAIDYATILAAQVIKNQSVTGSSQVARLYQNATTQSFDSNFVVSDLQTSSSKYVIEELYDVIRQTVQSPRLVAKPPVDLVRNVDIPGLDSLSPVVAGKLVLEEEYGLIISGSPDLRIILSLLESANE